MKKTILISAILLLSNSYSFAQNTTNGYLTDGFGEVVKSGFNLCWNSSSSNFPKEECGDKIAKPTILSSPAPIFSQPKKTVENKPEPKVISKNFVVNSNLLFKFDSSVISENGNKLIKQTIDLQPKEKITLIKIEGHTDKIGTETYNLKLSQKRADSLKNYIVSNGINPNLIQTKAFGESKPICTTNTILCNQQNRRVEFFIEYKE